MTREERNQQFVTYWERIRSKGKWNFAFRTGVLTWAIPVFVILELFRYFFRDGYQFALDRVLVGFVTWCVLGFFVFGLLMWWTNERTYRKLKQ